jgi:tetraacyldisaccharide-1-P 4'-kinase
MGSGHQGTRLLDYIWQSVIETAGSAWGGLLERGLGRLLDRSVVRRLAVPDGVAVVAIGGSTLGGSGKTPLAIECAGELARAGARAVLVGHAYRANPRRPRWVSPGDRLDEVGDEALLAARALEPLGVRVVVAPSRADAILLAAGAADVLVLDGIAQLAPVRVTLALLSLDGSDPWGRPRAMAPRGHLRAPVGVLVSACDALVPLTDPAGDATALADGEHIAGVATGGRNVWPARVESRGAWVDGGELMTWAAMRSLRVGLLVALGRPERIARWLSRRGVVPRAIVRGRDHGPFRPGARLAALWAGSCGIDVWLATPKCALHAARALPGLPVAVLDHSVALHLSLRTRLRAIAAPAALTGGGGTNSLELLESSRVVPSTAALYGPPATSLAASGEHDDMRPRA